MRAVSRVLGGVVAVAVALCAGAPWARAATTNVESCIPVATASQVNAIRNNLAGTYCLTADIDMHSIGNFVPIGSYPSNPFTGAIYGNGFVISNLKINDSTDAAVGLIGYITGGTIQDLGLVDVNVSGSATSAPLDTAIVGGLVGLGISSSYYVTIEGDYVTGSVTCVGDGCLAGGLAGYLISETLLEVQDSWSSATISGAGIQGGLAGAVASQPATSGTLGTALVTGSYATGSVTGETCAGTDCTVSGGLIGVTNGLSGPDTVLVLESFATGPVSVTGGAGAIAMVVGGLIGDSYEGTELQNCYSTGPVTGPANANGIGSLIGVFTSDGEAEVAQCYAAGAVNGGAGAIMGGLIGTAPSGAPVSGSDYWDTATTGQATSAANVGTGETTSQLQALPDGFSGVWGITPGRSFPFLNSVSGFASTLATAVVSNKLFTFLPISQLDLGQYHGKPKHTSAAGLAAVYTMLARAIGITDNVTTLEGVAIDKYFWDDATQTASFTGPITSHASLGTLVSLGKGATLSSAAVLTQFAHNHVLILRGTYTASGGTGTAYLLATLFTSDVNQSAVSAIVADDPWTGTQIEVNPVSKTIITAGFPLANFTVNAYRPVTFH
jgi:hypothetical protein